MSSLTSHDAQLEQFDRVRHMSTDTANRAIDASTRESIERATAGGRAAIEHRLAALQQEWDIDRVLMINLAVLVFAQLLAATPTTSSIGAVNGGQAAALKSGARDAKHYHDIAARGIPTFGGMLGRVGSGPIDMREGLHRC